MPEEFEYDDDPEDTDSNLVKQLRSQLKAKEKELRERGDADARAAAAERKLAFLEAGVPTNNKTKYFINGYDGDLTPEAIKAAAIEAELIDAPAPEVPSDEREAANRIAQATDGASLPPASEDAYEAAIQAAGSADEVLAILAAHGKDVVYGGQT